jgi:NAD-dependent dihydropyrimidine dehydrogenase PreA subunit
MQGFHYLSGVATLTYDAELCNGCRRCIDVCPHQVFDMQDKRARVVRKDDCMECGACALNCEPGALTVDSGVGCAAGLIVEWWREVTGRKDAGGACC